MRRRFEAKGLRAPEWGDGPPPEWYTDGVLALRFSEDNREEPRCQRYAESTQGSTDDFTVTTLHI